MEETIIVETGPREMKIGAEEKILLLSAAKWAQFISIVQFVFLGFGVLCLIFACIVFGFAGSTLGGMSAVFAAGLTGIILWPLMAFYLAIFVIGFILALYLYRFASNAKIAIASNNQPVMTESFRNLNLYMKLSGIMVIVSIVFCLIFMIIAFIAGATTA